MFAAALKTRTSNRTAIRTNCGFIFVGDDDARKVQRSRSPKERQLEPSPGVNHPSCENPIGCLQARSYGAGQIELGGT